MDTVFKNSLESLKNKGWEILDYNFAIETADRLFSKEIKELCEILDITNVDIERDIITGGGGKTLIVQDFEKKFKQKNWKKNNINMTNQISFENGINPKETKAASHEVDHLMISENEDLAILEIEWNNKSEFFDRDIQNILNAWQIQAIELGIIITRSKKLNESLKKDIHDYFLDNEIYDYDDFNKLEDKLLRFSFPSKSHRTKIDSALNKGKDFTEIAAEVFWASKYRHTTNTEQLIKRIERGQLGRAPLLVLGVPAVV